MRDFMIFVLILVALVVLLKMVQNICYTYCFVKNRKLELEHGIKENTMWNNTKKDKTRSSSTSKWI